MKNEDIIFHFNESEASELLEFCGIQVAVWETTKTDADIAYSNITWKLETVCRHRLERYGMHGEATAEKTEMDKKVEKIREVFRCSGLLIDDVVIPSFNNEEKEAIAEKLAELVPGVDAGYWSSDQLMAKIGKLIWHGVFDPEGACRHFVSERF